jgi:hypothetical protein
MGWFEVGKHLSRVVKEKIHKLKMLKIEQHVALTTHHTKGERIAWMDYRKS